MRQVGALPRERVNRALESTFAYPLTVVEAPIGYGKTTAVRQFLASKECCVLWISFLSSEDTVAYFWDRLSSEIGRLNEKVGGILRSLGLPADAPQTAKILSILNETGFDANTVLVIDDYHFVRDLQVWDLLRHVVAEEVGNLHIVVVTRDTSNLDVAELQAKGLCNLLPQETLRFSDNEVREYCTFMGFTPTEEEILDVCKYTGGWISMVYLIMLGIQRGIPMAHNSAIESLVERVLYDAYDEHIQCFLRRLSVMDGFTAEQALFVTQEPRAEELLRRLRRENAFIALDEATGTYRIHNVLLDYLRAKQNRQEERLSLYRRLGEWHLTQEAYRAAYESLSRAGETERILQILDSPGNVTNDFAEFEGSLEMFAAAPRDLLYKYPLAYLQYIGLLLTRGDPSAAGDGVARLDELESVYEGLDGIPLAWKNRILAEISAVRIFAVFNDTEKIVACATRALDLSDGSSSVLLKPENEFTFGSPHFLYSYYREPGRLKETADFMAAQFPVVHRLASGLGMGCDYLTLAEYALETGDEAAAELNAQKAIYKAQTKGQTGIRICASFALIRLYLYQGKIDAAYKQMSQLEKDVAKENNAIYNTTLELVCGYAAACLGRLHSIPEWLQTGDMSPAHFMYQGLAFNYIVYGKAVLLAKDYVRLEMLAEESESRFAVLHNQIGFLHNRILRAAAKYHTYGMEAGCAELRGAVLEASEDHIILPFAEYAPDIFDMVGNLAQADPGDAYIQELQKACERYMEVVRSASHSEVPLSPRELEVLALASEGLRRDEIARRLHVTAGTVQVHLHNIYGKLEVNGRTAAVRKAQRLGLL